MDTDTDGVAADGESKDAPNIFPTSFMSAVGSPVSFASVTGISSGFSSNHSFGFSHSNTSNTTTSDISRLPSPALEAAQENVPQFVPLFGRGTSFGTSSSSASTFQSSFGALESSSGSNKRSRKPVNESAVEDILGQICQSLNNLTTSEQTNEDKLKAFLEVLSCSQGEAIFYLESSGWDIETAATLFIETQGGDVSSSSHFPPLLAPMTSFGQQRYKRPYANKWNGRDINIEGLDPMWTAKVSRSTGTVYFVHNESGHKQGHVPDGFADALPESDEGDESCNMEHNEDGLDGLKGAGNEDLGPSMDIGLTGHAGISSMHGFAPFHTDISLQQGIEDLDNADDLELMLQNSRSDIDGVAKAIERASERAASGGDQLASDTLRQESPFLMSQQDWPSADAWTLASIAVTEEGRSHSRSSSRGASNNPFMQHSEMTNAEATVADDDI